MFRKTLITIFIFIIFTGFGYSEEKYFLKSEKVVSVTGKIPQAPRVSPDGKKLLYEVYSRGESEIVLCDADGKNKFPLTKGLINKAENAFWHPSQNYISFNIIPKGKIKNGYIYVARLRKNKLSNLTKIDLGARAQFSKPNGTVIFYENTVKRTEGNENTLKYKILGQNPLKPIDGRPIILRGPIEVISRNVELSHPSLAPDGSTILFAARTSTGGEIIKEFKLTDGERQRAVGLWEEIVKSDFSEESLQNELKECFGSDDREKRDIKNPVAYVGTFGSDTYNKIKKKLPGWKKQSTLVQGYNRKDFVVCWLLGFFGKMDLKDKYDHEQLLYSRIWKTDVFGADIVPLVSEDSKVPLPQKWATVASSGKFAVLEAGHYRNRHIYLVSLANQKVIKLTSKGTYNSSPELSFDQKWLYFETNRGGVKEIWRARLNLKKITGELK